MPGPFRASTQVLERVGLKRWHKLEVLGRLEVAERDLVSVRLSMRAQGVLLEPSERTAERHVHNAIEHIDNAINMIRYLSEKDDAKNTR